MKLSLFLFVVSLICFGLQFEPAQSYVIWNHADIAHGQWWRIVSGNFTHTNFAHLAMDLAGLWIIGFVFHPKVQTTFAVMLLLSVIVGTSLLATNIHNYLGLSGILHGLVAYFALTEALQGRKSSALLVIAVIAKVVWDQVVGPSTLTSEWIDAPIATQAHFAGLLGGLGLGLSAHLTQKWKWM